MSNFEKQINASPTKDFFILMLIKDIELIPAIIDLVDNSVDGARRMRCDKDYSGLEIEIKTQKDSFKITDNCGGIPVETARNYAFRFGRPSLEESGVPDTPYSIGFFGVGMKRALFKLGKKFRIESRTLTSYFVVEVDVDEWRQKKEDNHWTFEFKELQENIAENQELPCGTTITVTSLHQNTSEDFVLENFRTKLSQELENTQWGALEKNLVIRLNDRQIKGHPLELLQSEMIKPAFLEEKDPNDPKVGIKIYAGILKGGENEKDNPSAAGWYILCNERLIVKANKDLTTGWGEKNGETMQNFHNDYAKFRGFVFFDSEDPKLLPWNTTKTGIDLDSPIFRRTRLKMIQLARPVLEFLRNFRDEKKQEIIDSQTLESAVSKAPVVRLSQVLPNRVFSSPSLSTLGTGKIGQIQYKKPLEQIDLVKKALDVKSNLDVGSKTFDYFFDRECGDS